MKFGHPMSKGSNPGKRGRKGGNLYGDVGVKGGWRSEKLTLFDAS